MIGDVLTQLPLSALRRAVAISLGLALLWVVLALIRSGTTFHLAPALVAAVFPVAITADANERVSTRQLAVATLAGLAIALVATLILTLAGEMTGPSLLPFGGAVSESVVFAVAGAITGFGIGALRR